MTERDFPLPTSGGSFERDPKTGTLTPRPVWTPEEAADFKRAEEQRAIEAKAEETDQASRTEAEAQARPDAKARKA